MKSVGEKVIKLSFSRRAWNACEILYHSRRSEHVIYVYVTLSFDPLFSFIGNFKDKVK